MKTPKQQEKFIEDYTDKRLKEFLIRDRLSKTEIARIKKRSILKSVAKKFSEEAQRKSITLETLLKDLRQVRRKIL